MGLNKCKILILYARLLHMLLFVVKAVRVVIDEYFFHPGERDLPLASEGVFEEYAGHGLEHREDQGGRRHVPTKRE